MNQLKLSFVLASALVGAAATGLGGCSDDDGSKVVPKDPNAQAGSGGGSGTGGGDALGGSAGLGGSGGGAGMSGGGGAAGASMRPACPAEPEVVDAGADDAGVSDAGAGDAGDAGTAARALSFATDIHPILRNYCRPCHEDEFSGGHNLAADDPAEAYGFLFEVAPRLVGRINGGGMPPACGDGVPGDTDCITVAELELIQSWESQCYPP
ncbi:MAG: hypothetical protein RL033_724 [Pseudomonadota bacterium]|jgi:hypothetical protein